MCETRIALFDTRLGIAEEVRGVDLSRGVAIPNVDAVPAHETRGLPVVEVTASELRFDGRAVDEATLADNLATLRRNWGVLHPQDPLTDEIALYADRTLPMSRVSVLAAGPLAGWQVVLMARARTHPRASELPRCPATLGADCARLAAASDGDRATILGAVNTRAVRTCAPAVRAFGAVAGARLTEAAATRRRGLVAAARECGCDRLDLDALEYAALLGDGALAPPVGGFVLPETLDEEELRLGTEAWILGSVRGRGDTVRDPSTPR